MKVIFVCGSLDPGHDGVGDYVRLLTNELNKQGHQVLALSLNDYGVSDTWSGNQQVGNGVVQVLRLSSAMEWNVRVELAKKWIADFSPELLSLQFVPFAFHEKGLPFKVINRLKQMNPGVKWHIMFHELWVGMDLDASKKLRLWGWVQQRIIKSLVKKLKPVSVHTQTQIYKRQLTGLGCKALHLPLFSNIQWVNNGAAPKQEMKLSFIVFGTIHPQAPINEFAKEASAYAELSGLALSFTFIGRNGSELNNWTAVLQRYKIDFFVLGEVAAERISGELNSASVGISTTPLQLVEKSGTVAAMREHGLPILCISKEWKVKPGIRFQNLPFVLNYHQGDFAKYVKLEKQQPAYNQLNTIGRQFIEDLNSTI